MKQNIRVACVKCGTINIVPVSEISNRSYVKEGEVGVLCINCCKKAYFYREDKCKNCSDFMLCRYGLKKGLKVEEKGV